VTVPKQACKCTGALDHAFGEVVSKASKTHHLFVEYLDNAYFSVLESS
jgi:hypothetical protein